MDFPMHYPASMDVQLLLTDGKGRQAVATIEFAVGRFLSKEDIKARIAEFERDEMPEGFRLMTKLEAWDYAMQQATGSSMRFAIPGGDDFDD